MMTPDQVFIKKKWVLRFLLLAAIVLFTVPPAMAANVSLTSPDGRGWRTDDNGWIYLHIEGPPYERGFQHGYLAAPEIAEIIDHFKYLTLENTGMEWSFFVNESPQLFLPYMDEEYTDEIKGIAAGAQARGVDVSWQEILTWNGYEELTGYWWPSVASSYSAAATQPDKEHCSAFIATGSYTKGKKIVMAHNSWDDFYTGQYFNVVLDIRPEQGHRILMQAAPGFIDSGTDFFVTDAGIMGTETTIGGFSPYKSNESPEFYRARKAIQYADTLDQWALLMKKQNNGGYANSWLLGDASTGEIMRFELGLAYSNITKTQDGYFIGYNEATDPRIRNLECSDPFHSDIRTPFGARQVRFTQLMNQYRGKIDTEIAKTILADHYDVYLKKENPGSRTIDGHYELDNWEYVTIPGHPAYQPKGAVDGKVTDSDLAKNLSFWARFGNSAGMPFYADEFLAEHIQYDYLRGYLKDRPTQPWTEFAADHGTVAVQPLDAPAPAAFATRTGLPVPVIIAAVIAVMAGTGITRNRRK